MSANTKSLASPAGLAPCPRSRSTKTFKLLFFKQRPSAAAQQISLGEREKRERERERKKEREKEREGRRENVIVNVQGREEKRGGGGKEETS